MKNRKFGGKGDIGFEKILSESDKISLGNRPKVVFSGLGKIRLTTDID